MKYVFVSFLFLTSIQGFSQSFYVPDDNFEQALIDLGYDDVLDDSVLYSSVDWLGYLDVSSAGIESLEGIAAFTSLETLWCSGNDISSIDISSNVNLQSFRISSNSLTTLDLSTNVELEELICSTNNLTALDLSSNLNITDLWCENNYLTSLDLNVNTEVESIVMYYNELTSLDVGTLGSLYQLDCRFNNLIALDLTNNTELWQLSISGNEIAELDLLNNEFLAYLDASDNPFTELDLSNQDSLKSLNCIGGNVKNLNLDHSSELVSLHLEDGVFEALSIQNGNNTLMGMGHVFLEGNPLLSCVLVDDPTYSTLNWLDVDDILSFSLECDYSNVEDEIELKYRVYPNPTKKFLFLEMNSEAYSMNLYAMDGTLLKTSKLNTGINKIDINGFAKGLYVMEMVSENNVYSERIVIQ